MNNLLRDGHPSHPMRSVLRWVSYLLLLVLLLFGGSVTLSNTLAVALSSHLGFILATTGAFVTLSIFLAAYWFIIPHQKSNKMLLVAGFVWGGAASAGVSMFINGMNVVASETVSMTIVAPIAEELTKAIFIVFILQRYRVFFLSTMDAIIIGGSIGLGFAFIENINYYFAAFSGFDLTSGESLSKSGTSELLTSLLARTGSGLVHPFFTTITLLFVLRALREKILINRLAIGSFGLSLAMVLHGLWNLNAVADFTKVTHTIISVVFAAGVATLVSFSVNTWGSENKEWKRALGDLVSLGVLTENDANICKSAKNQKQFRRFALRYGGEMGLRDAKRLQCGVIGLTRWYIYSCYIMRLDRAIIANEGVDEKMGKLRGRVLYMNSELVQ